MTVKTVSDCAQRTGEINAIEHAQALDRELLEAGQTIARLEDERDALVLALRGWVPMEEQKPALFARLSPYDGSSRLESDVVLITGKRTSTAALLTDGNGAWWWEWRPHRGDGNGPALADVTHWRPLPPPPATVPAPAVASLGDWFPIKQKPGELEAYRTVRRIAAYATIVRKPEGWFAYDSGDCLIDDTFTDIADTFHSQEQAIAAVEARFAEHDAEVLAEAKRT